MVWTGVNQWLRRLAFVSKMVILIVCFQGCSDINISGTSSDSSSGESVDIPAASENAEVIYETQCLASVGISDSSAGLPITPNPNASAAPSQWIRYDFVTAFPSGCTGARFVGFSAKYGLWVGAQLCGNSGSEYMLYLSHSKTAPFLEIGDRNYNGEDHCELVNPDFSLSDDGAIKSGGCDSCDLILESDLQPKCVYNRHYLGQPFSLEMTGVWWNEVRAASYKCGISIQ